MEYWLLLAFVLSILFAIFSQSVGLERKARLPITVGFAFLAISLGLEVILRHELQDWAARGFYWARISVTLAWLGHGTFALAWPKLQALRWPTRALVAASAVMLLLAALAPITAAEDWFRPGLPIYSQLGDLLATNRPLRWGALALNLYGTAGLIGGAAMLLWQKRGLQQAIRFAAATAGAAVLLIPIYWPPQSAEMPYFLSQSLTPLLLFIGLNTADTEIKKSRAKKRKR